jgi:murein DD-endopeptidase MepM/ murein hydrolase activator NlpD
MPKPTFRVAISGLVGLTQVQAALPAAPVQTQQPAAAQPLVRSVDLAVGEEQELVLADGSRVRVKLLSLEETRDSLRQAVRQARVKLQLNGTSLMLTAATYHLPVSVAGVQVDCPVTGGYTLPNPKANPWGLYKDARIRLWPGGWPWMRPGTFTCPVRQRWLVSDTQMANEPTFVNGDERPGHTNIYYHYGLDFGGAEGLVEVVSATDGLVVSAAGQTLAGYADSPVRPRADVIYIVDELGWYYRYSHLQTVEVRAGQRVRMGQRLGLLGKEGSSGGWAHLHFDITRRQPSGVWGIEEAYAYVWEAWRNEYRPKLVAVARPHQLAAVGAPVVLDGSKSWSADNSIMEYRWHFSDGTTTSGPVAWRTYRRPGTYSEVLKVTDRHGRAAWDFAVVQVLDPTRPDQLPPTIHAAYAPTFDVRAGDQVTFKVRSFRTQEGHETWDFGDGTPPVQVRSDGNARVHDPAGYAITTHRFDQAGDYLVRVQRTNARGETAQGHLWVQVAQAFRPRTVISIHQGRWHLNGQVTYRGAAAEGLLMNVRMVNAVFEDRRKPEFDPEANTDRFLARLPDYAAHGVRAFTLCLQGGMPGYEGALNSAFEPDGALRPAYLARVRRVIEACDRLGVAVILGCFYQRQDQVLPDAGAVRAAVTNVAAWIRRAGLSNVVLEVANEFDHPGFDHPILRSVDGQIELMNLARQTAPGLLVSTSASGHGRYPDSLARAADFLLIHFNNTSLADIPARIHALKTYGKPIVCNEDDKQGAEAAQAAALCVAHGASWGLMLNKLNQYVPFEFHGAADDPVVYGKLKELTTP